MKRTCTLVCILFFCHSLFGQKKNEKLKITPLTGDFYIYTTYKEFENGTIPSNGLYLVTDSGAVIIDGPWDTTQCQPLLDTIKNMHHKDVVICIATHSHDDRTGGLEYFNLKGIKTYTSVKTDGISKDRNEKRAANLFLNDTTFTIGQYSFETYYPGAGHTDDNIVVWFPRDKILYGGCLVKSVEANDLGNLQDANQTVWPHAIKKIKTKYGRPSYVIPGHFKSSKGTVALDHTLQLLK